MKTHPDAHAFAVADAAGLICDGLSKREWLAGMAMFGLTAIKDSLPEYEPRAVAARSVAYADALIAALNAETPAPSDVPQLPPATAPYWTPPGSIVCFAFPNNGSDKDQLSCAANLKVGGIYTLDRSEIRDYSTTFFLVGISGGFNSVMFSVVDFAPEVAAAIKKAGKP